MDGREFASNAHVNSTWPRHRPRGSPYDQFLRIEEGQATVYLGATKDSLDTQQAVDGDAVLVPSGAWHNLVNTGSTPLKSLFNLRHTTPARNSPCHPRRS